MKLFWLFTALTVLAGCSDATPISLTNRSRATLDDVVVAGSGFERAVGSIAPGNTAIVRVRPSGESGLKLSFRSGSKSFDLPMQGYFEGGGSYTVKVVVGPDLNATVDASLRY